MYKLNTRVWSCSLAIMLAMVLALPAVTLASESEEEEGYISLFNGKDLEGWVVQGLEKAKPDVEDGVLVVGGWDYWAVITEKEFHNFTLKLDYMVEERGNSGVLIHAPKEEVYKHAFEIQIADDAGEDPSKETTGAIFDHVAPSSNPQKPAGEWNSMTIHYEEPSISVMINGETVIDQVDITTLEDLEHTHEKGAIALQRNDYKKAVHYKNIRIKPLD